MVRNDIKIGRNIKSIRNANKKSYIDFSADIGVSDSYLEKLENGSRPATDDVIKTISKRTGFLFHDIIFGDLTYLEKGDLSFDKELELKDAISELDLNNHFTELLKKLYPFVSDVESLKSESFSKGFEIVNKITTLDFESSEVIEAINYFISAKEEGINELSSFNVLSCFGYYYMIYFNGIREDFNEEALNKSTVKTMSDFTGKLSKINDISIAAKRKKIFLENYNRILTKHMSELNKSNSHQDYAIYFLCIRYIFGLLDKSITKLDDLQMELFGLSLLDSLAKMGNKYAIELSGFLE